MNDKKKKDELVESDKKASAGVKVKSKVRAGDDWEARV